MFNCSVQAHRSASRPYIRQGSRDALSQCDGSDPFCEYRDLQQIQMENVEQAKQTELFGFHAPVFLFGAHFNIPSGVASLIFDRI
jgi:hypothetical protein